MSNINTVGKLIEELSKLDKEAPVYINKDGVEITEVDYYSAICIIKAE